MKFNAMEIEAYRHGGSPFVSYAAGVKTKPMLIRLAEILDQLEPQGEDALHTIWGKADRPTFRQFYAWHYEDDMPYRKAADDVKKSARREYADLYPTPKVWYRLSVKHFPRNANEEFYALFIDDSYVFSVNDINSTQEYEDTELLRWAIEEAERFVAEVRKETYEKNILSKIPYDYREGRIKRGDLWEVHPEERERFYAGYKMDDVRRFLGEFSYGAVLNTPFREMTAGRFYEACAVVYTALGLCKEKTPKEMYYAVADGRDDGLKDVSLDDPAAFEEWFNKSGADYAFNGSHPWEIIPSMSLTNSMHLYPRNDENTGWHFLLSGESELRAPDAVTAALALRDSGYPVEVYAYDIIADRLEGNDHLSVVSRNELVCFSEAIHLPDGKVGKAVAAKTTWKLDRYSMKNS